MGPPERKAPSWLRRAFERVSNPGGKELIRAGWKSKDRKAHSREGVREAEIRSARALPPRLRDQLWWKKWLGLAAITDRASTRAPSLRLEAG